MLQIDLKPYASDALEDAMRLAQTKSLNSFTFSDCLNYLNYAWSDIYDRVACIDSGYYSRCVHLTEKTTKLPPFVKNTVHIFRAQSLNDNNRTSYKSAGYNDMNSAGVYYISGTDLHCADAVRYPIWLEYVPSPPLLTFPFHNRDPILHDEEIEPDQNTVYGMQELLRSFDGKYCLVLRNDRSKAKDVSELFEKEGHELVFLSCDWPYIFVTFKNNVTGEYTSGFYDKDLDWNEYNPFHFTGRRSNVEYVKVKWNDKTGMGVIVKDHNDGGKLKELGWTPDTMLDYPSPVMYRYLVARLADKFSALNESNVMGVQKELIEARYAFEAFLDKDKSSWKKIDNVTGPTIADYL